MKSIEYMNVCIYVVLLLLLPVAMFEQILGAVADNSVLSSLCNAYVPDSFTKMNSRLSVLFYVDFILFIL